jgi:hypothetical protein
MGWECSLELEHLLSMLVSLSLIHNPNPNTQKADSIIPSSAVQTISNMWLNILSTEKLLVST